jgi:hypothetical protein
LMATTSPAHPCCAPFLVKFASSAREVVCYLSQITCKL